VPVTFMVPDQDMEAFARENIGEELFDKMDGLDQSDLSLAEKKQVVHEAMLKFRSAVKGKSFPLKSQEQSFTLIKDNGSWRISIVAAGFANMLGL